MKSFVMVLSNKKLLAEQDKKKASKSTKSLYNKVRNIQNKLSINFSKTENFINHGENTLPLLFKLSFLYTASIQKDLAWVDQKEMPMKKKVKMHFKLHAKTNSCQFNFEASFVH